MSAPVESLIELCESLYFPLNIRIQEATRYQYRLALNCYGRFLGRPATTADLADEPVTRWMSKRLQEGLASITVRERAGRVQTLWTWLAKRRVVDQFPTFIKPEAAESHPCALSVAQLAALFRSAGKERGTVGGIPADLWWLSFLGFVWNTAERKTAALAVRPDWLLLDDPLCAKASIPPHVRKGRKKWGVYDLWPETVPMLREVIEAGRGSEVVWPFPYSPQSYYTRYNRILKDAGIPVNRKTKTHSLRVSHATWRTVAGGDATRQLMHSDPATTARHYIDRTKLPPDPTRLFIPWHVQQSDDPPRAA